MENLANHMGQHPIKELIGAPFRAVMESQVALAASTHEFIELIGFDEEGDLKTIDFNVPVANTEDNGSISYSNKKIKTPILSVVPIPSLMIDKVSVDFQLEVNTAVSSQDTKNDYKEKNKKTNLMGARKTELIGKITESRENTRKTSQGAKYNFHVEAKMQDKPEGLQKVLDLIIAKMTP